MEKADPNAQWFETFRNSIHYQTFKKRPVAYFCAEFALSDTIPIYAGGLGVLAADFIKEASDQNFPLVGVGLYYHQGYVSQKIDELGVITELRNVNKPTDVELVAVLDHNQKRIIVDVPIQDRIVHAQAWKWQNGSVPVYLLDTDIAENDPNDRRITNRLYDLDKETRFRQEMILGIGGIRLLEFLQIHPYVYHMNEGHSAMLVLDLIRHEMVEHKIGFIEAKELTSHHIIFTNHTLLPAGNELYSNDLASTLLSAYAQELAVPITDIVALGLVQESSIFSMTMLSLRLAARINAVSRLHLQKAKEIWTNHPMESVTNGIHIPTWNQLESTDSLWESHQENKKKLLTEIKKTNDIDWDENILLLGWARRLVAYKRPLALFEDLEWFKSLAENTNQPIRVVISGQSPPGDTKGKEILQKLESLVTKDLKGIVVYLPTYNLSVSKLLIAGCDVWLNTPVVGFEACGTSGMKAALNGVLPASTKDGWIDEVDLQGAGWILDNDKIAQSLLDVLEKQIVPMYYAVSNGGKPNEWVRYMQHACELIYSQFSTTRMLRNYIETMYLPALKSLPATPSL